MTDTYNVCFQKASSTITFRNMAGGTYSGTDSCKKNPKDFIYQASQACSDVWPFVLHVAPNSKQVTVIANDQESVQFSDACTQTGDVLINMSAVFQGNSYATQGGKPTIRNESLSVGHYATWGFVALLLIVAVVLLLRRRST
jgi:hypothetical protein